MIVMSLTLLFTAATPTGFTSSVERVALVKTGEQPASVDVDSLGARLHLHGVKPANAKGSQLCPTLAAEHGGLVMRCTTRRLWAEISEDHAGLFLDVRSLRGVIDDQLTLRPWPLSALNIPETCPGESAAARAECSLATGNLEVAEKLFKEALVGPDLNLAQLRLGDFAMRRGDTEEALKMYSKVTPGGPVGRMARARACDLTSACIVEPEAVDIRLTEATPEPLRTELELYALRRQASSGDINGAITRLNDRIAIPPLFCAHTKKLCQEVARAALEADDDSVVVAGLQAFTNDDVRWGPLHHELTIAAAEASVRMGAPGYAAALLASETRAMPTAELENHLLRVSHLFLAAGDTARAAVILEYATERLGKTMSQQWRAIRRAVGQPSAPTMTSVEPHDLTALESQTDLTNELARAATVRTRATISREEKTP